MNTTGRLKGLRVTTYGTGIVSRAGGGSTRFSMVSMPQRIRGMK